MLEPKSSIPLLYSNGQASTYGINVGKYPHHAYVADVPRKLLPELPLTVDFCRRDEWVNGCYRKCLGYELCTIEMVEQGSLLLARNGNCQRINAGELYLLHRGSDHEVLVDQPMVKKITIAFGGNMVEQLIDRSGLSDLNKIVPDKPERFLRLWHEMLAELRQREDGFQLRCSAIAYNLLLEIGRCRIYHHMPELIIDAMIMMDR
ncbi:MAG: AraC family ligand binding domain-containing protein, partial [Victivallales bacterium]|nr:AraC family ligand binding domain-containing protein [Victivallales bacterium]